MSDEHRGHKQSGEGSPNGTLLLYLKQLRRYMEEQDRINREHSSRKNYLGLPDWTDEQRSDRENNTRSCG